MQDIEEPIEELVKPGSNYVEGLGSSIKKGKGWQSVEYWGASVCSKNTNSVKW